MAWVVVGGAAVMGGFGLLGSYIQGQAAEDASATQATAATTAATTEATAAQAGIDEMKRQYDAMQALLKPYTEAGTQSLTAQQDLAGLNGPEAQSAALKGISDSPEMLALTQSGENAILSQGAATGGLRGGNTQGALAQFRPQALSSLISQQYGRLSGITQLGQASAAGVGAAGLQTGQSVAGLLGQQGAATAGGITGAAQATAGGQLAAGQAAAAPFNMLSQYGGLYALKGMGVF